ncbi:uracil-DNA glycosylase [Anguillid herpesvirus 1]|uniref:Uracil-DNA glycosylase n=1 Tax=Anguillid herpesvirus 1 TaxID=150286 RepID=A0A1J0REI4_9VIRU|nr:uracil-DNA glycosylase [Anguillid herpesvirus 1]ADA57792.1 uracil-DNA glycosylase [Anguillid herpesvirus 1]APD76192.1 uracil-DNA glycosylase [Anguillid herpesvirus 1]QRM16323.1 uracil-DNA glycosylase [Anguillid herpesvirus 1]QRM16453.1 uracil-DNA glycosylase [Anguillid herpesvirus 1]QRM16582.1 uracil-DNA glycosylase [Anguillid herpesvirus 1]
MAKRVKKGVPEETVDQKLIKIRRQIRRDFRGPLVDIDVPEDGDIQTYSDVVRKRALEVEYKNQTAKPKVTLRENYQTAVKTQDPFWVELAQDLSPFWKDFVLTEGNRIYAHTIKAQIVRLKEDGQLEQDLSRVLACLRHTAKGGQVKVLLIGGKPSRLHNHNGLGFGSSTPTKLHANIVQELTRTLSEEGVRAEGTFDHTMTHWANQNILLIPTHLTSGGDIDHGALWAPFICALVRLCLDVCKVLAVGVIGAPAGKIAQVALNMGTGQLAHNQQLFSAAHPSLADFICSNIFYHINSLLVKNKIKPIEWFM